MQVIQNEWISAGVRHLLKRAITKGLRGDDKRTALLFTELATESLLEFARGTFRQEVEVECAHWIRAAAVRRERVLAMSIGDAERVYGKALAESDLMVKQAQALFDLMDGRIR